MSLRPAQRADAPAVTRIFQSARAHSLAYLPITHSDAEDHAFFAARRRAAAASRSPSTMAPSSRSWRSTATRSTTSTSIPAITARATAPRCWRPRRPRHEHLELWVFQRNLGAIAFYEAHGFAIVASTDGAGNEEHEPDHRMAWSLR